MPIDLLEQKFRDSREYTYEFLIRDLRDFAKRIGIELDSIDADINAINASIGVINADLITIHADIAALNAKNTWATIRLTSTVAASLAATTHAFQIGPSNGLNLAASPTIIQARNNGAASALFLNPAGGSVALGGPLDLSSTSSGQIGFPAVQNSSSSPNVLDDYEEGTFTPVIIGVTVTGVGTYTRQTGFYTKNGRIVSTSIQIIWTNHTGTGGMLITGLPFTSAALEQPVAIVPENITFTGQIGARVNGNTTLIIPLSIVSNANAATINMDTSGQFQVNGSYMV